jgi:formyltetrahydrofolate synthetase
MTLIDSGGGQSSVTPIAAMINLPSSGDRYKIYYANNQNYEIINNLSIGEWRMITLTGDGTYFTLYENGTQIDQRSNNHILNISLDTYISRNMHADEWHFNGTIDEVGIWNRVLNSTEVATLYNDGEGLTYS